MKSRPREAGFALAELIVAAVLTAAAGALLAGALISANRSNDLRGHRALTTQWLASELALLPEIAAPGTHAAGTLPSPDEDVAWTQDTEADPSGLPLVTVRVQLSGGQTADVVTSRPAAPQ